MMLYSLKRGFSLASIQHLRALTAQDDLTNQIQKTDIFMDHPDDWLQSEIQLVYFHLTPSPRV